MPDLETAIKKLEELGATHPATLALLRRMRTEVQGWRTTFGEQIQPGSPICAATDAAERDFIAAVGGGE